MGAGHVIVPAVLSALFARCAPHVGPRTMAAVVAYESGGKAYAIGDNTARRSYFPAELALAKRLAAGLLARGHNIDVGYAQINSDNFERYALDLDRAFEPCTNVAVGASILRSNYVSAARAFGGGQVALRHALSAYNTGGYWAGLGYARGVYAAAEHLHYVAAPAAERIPGGRP